MKHPDGLLYTKDHEWVSIQDGVATIGITDFAQDALGDVVYVDLPEVGAEVKADETISEVESTKSVSDIMSPVDGTIKEVNEALDVDASVLNSDPYEQGWICKIETSSTGEGLMDVVAYRAFIEE